MTERVEEISWELFHLDCEHEWRTKGEDAPVPRHACGDCVRAALTTALAQAEREREKATERASQWADIAGGHGAEVDRLRAEVKRLKKELEDGNGAYRDVMKEACAGGITYDTDDRLHCTCVPHLREGVKTLQADLARVRAALEKSARAYHHEMHVVGTQSGPFETCVSPVCRAARAALEGRG